MLTAAKLLKQIVESRPSPCALLSFGASDSLPPLRSGFGRRGLIVFFGRILGLFFRLSTSFGGSALTRSFFFSVGVARISFIQGPPLSLPRPLPSPVSPSAFSSWTHSRALPAIFFRLDDAPGSRHSPKPSSMPDLLASSPRFP